MYDTTVSTMSCSMCCTLSGSTSYKTIKQHCGPVTFCWNSTTDITSINDDDNGDGDYNVCDENNDDDEKE